MYSLCILVIRWWSSPWPFSCLCSVFSSIFSSVFSRSRLDYRSGRVVRGRIITFNLVCHDSRHGFQEKLSRFILLTHVACYLTSTGIISEQTNSNEEENASSKRHSREGWWLTFGRRIERNCPKLTFTVKSSLVWKEGNQVVFFCGRAIGIKG